MRLTPFPFSEKDWLRVERAATELVNASAMEDAVLCQSGFATLQHILRDLATKYGEHPLLLETEADFADDPQLCCRLYEEAKGLATQNGLPVYTISLSYAHVKLDCGSLHDALRELTDCKCELDACGDEQERAQWQDLFQRAEAACKQLKCGE